VTGLAPAGAARPAGPAAAALGRLLVLTDRRACARPLPDVVRAAVDGGARTVVLREKDLPLGERARLADQLRAVLGDGLLVLAGSTLRCEPTGTPPGGPAGHTDALHLSAADDLPARRPALLGRSCHDAAEVTRAAAEGCDWVTVSPVWETASKPGYGPPLGPPGLAALLPGAPPAYGLGGVDGPDRARACRAAGTYGVAVLGTVMRAARPDRAVAGLLAALGEGP